MEQAQAHARLTPPGSTPSRVRSRLLGAALLGLALAACGETPAPAEPGPEEAVSTAALKGGPPDTTPPTLVSTSPANRAAGVSVNAGISFRFSEPMDVGSVLGAISSTPPVSCPRRVVEPPAATVTCIPRGALEPNTAYAVSLGPGPKDAAGNPLAVPKGGVTFGFTTGGPPDPTPITIVGSLPAHTAVGVPRYAVITIKFSEPMDRASTEAAFKATRSLGSVQHQPIVFKPAVWDAASTEVTFEPAALLDYGALVHWTVGSTARDQTGHTFFGTTRQFKVVQLGIAKLVGAPSPDGHILYTAWEDIWGSDHFKYTPYPAETVVRVGDREDWGADTDYSRGFLSFDLSGLPQNLVAIKSATLVLFQAKVSGNPYATAGCGGGWGSPNPGLGTLWVESVSYGGTLDAGPGTNPGDMHAAPNTPIKAYVAPASAPNVRVVNVYAFLNADWQNRAARGHRSQYRLSFSGLYGCTPPSHGNNNDGESDYVDFASADHPEVYHRPLLEVSYEYP